MINSNEKPLSVIHVDVDSLWTIKQDFGHQAYDKDCLAYKESIPHFLELFESEKIKATFFAIGNDAKHNISADMIHKMATKGHEIGNHTMNHRTDFSNISLKEMINEITECDSILSEVTNTNIIGFRSPGYYFKYQLIETLLKLGYKYDTSSLPTILLPLMNLIHIYLSKFKNTNKQLGSIRDVLRGIKPYYLNSQGTMSSISTSDGILVIPITVTPILRLPFHSTVVFSTGERYFDMSIRLVKMFNLPLIYLFHAIDLFPDLNYKDEINHPTIRSSFLKRYDMVKNIIKCIKKNYNIVSTSDFIKYYKL